MATSKRDYVAIARAIKAERIAATTMHDGAYQTGMLFSCSRIEQALADYFASDNPRFDRSRFLEACGVNG